MYLSENYLFHLNSVLTIVNVLFYHFYDKVSAIVVLSVILCPSHIGMYTKPY